MLICIDAVTNHEVDSGVCDPDISLRKQPSQACSTELVATILEAAVLLLEKEGSQWCATARIAEKADFSVGSLYRYFPNKASILSRLQAEE